MQEHLKSAGSKPEPSAAGFEQIYRDHLAYVWANLRGLGVDDRDLEDAAQDVFLVYHRRRAKLDHARRLRPWLFGVARRVAARYRRGRARRHRLRHRLAAEPRPAGGLERGAELREAAKLVDGFLQRLDEDKRVVFVLAEMQQRTAREIADILGVSSNTVSSRLRLGRRAFDRHFARLRARDGDLAELGSELTADALLSSARSGYRPTPTQRTRIVAALGAGLRGTATATRLTTGLAGAGAYATLAAAVLVAAVVGVELRSPPSPTPVSAQPQTLLTENAPGPRASVPGERSGPAPAGVGPAPDAAAESGSTSVSASVSRTPAEASRSLSHRRPHPLPNGDWPPEDSGSGSTPSSEPSPEPAPVADSPLAEEMRLLAETRAALRAGNSKAALALTDEHARRFRAGALAFERSKLRISALCASGGRARAHLEIEALRARAPAASIASEIDRLCPGRPAPHPTR